MKNSNATTTWTGIAAAITTGLTILAALPYSLGDAAEIISPEWKAKIVVAGLVASTILKIWNSVATAGTGEVKRLEEKVDEATK